MEPGDEGGDALEARIRAACDARRWDEAATIAIGGYGQELASYLHAVLRNAADADDVFGELSLALWKGLPEFRWSSTFRTYAYAIARHAWLRKVRDPARKREGVPLSSPVVEGVVAKVRTETAAYLKTEVKDKVAALRATLDPDDQSLLVLRVDRKLAWNDIAQIMDASPPALRKRFERLKAEIRKRLS